MRLTGCSQVCVGAVMFILTGHCLFWYGFPHLLRGFGVPIRQSVAVAANTGSVSCLAVSGWLVYVLGRKTIVLFC